MNKVKLGLFPHTNSNVMTRMAMQIVNNLKRDGDPKTENNNQHHDQLVRIVGFFGEQKVAHTKQHILGIEQNVVDEIAEASRSCFEVKVDENVNKRANKVVELLENFLARAIDLLGGDAVVCFQA